MKTAQAIRAANAGSKILGSIGRPDQSHGYEYMKELFRFNDFGNRWTWCPCMFTIETRCHSGRERNSRAQGVARSKPVWITETSVPSAGRHFWMSEAWQANWSFVPT